MKFGWTGISPFRNAGKDLGLEGSSRLSVVNIGSSDCFLLGAQFVYKASSMSESGHRQMNYENFSQWLTYHIIASLPSSSVVVMDCALSQPSA
jgi:hypothetical protein